MLPIAFSYFPAVGDVFTQPAKARIDPRTGEPCGQTPEVSARITLMSNNHVVVVINGLESTYSIGRFIRIATGTLAKGAQLSRAPEGQMPG